MSTASTSASSSSSGTKPTKKARVAASAQPVVGSDSKKRTRKRLPSLHEMPYDIFIEILLQIDPKGLINLARTNKDTRRALVNKNMEKVVWKSAREDCKALEPPPGWSEAKWVSFLFSSFCYSCGKGNATIDFYILKRLCSSCKKAGLRKWFDIIPNTMKSGKGQELVNSNCILFTKYPESTRKRAGYHNMFWKDDFDNTFVRWTTLIERIDGDSNEDALRELQTFKKDRADFVHAVHKNALPMREWEENVQKERKQDLKSNKQRLLASIHQRFMESGLHKRVDIEAAINMSTTGICGSASTEVTNRSWKTWRAKLEPAVYSARNIRLKNIRTRRMDHIVNSWRLWVDALQIPTIERLSYPDSRDIWHHPAVTALREADPEVLVSSSVHEKIIDDFPNIATDFVHRRRQELSRMVPLSTSVLGTLDLLELATSVFTAPARGSEIRAYGHDTSCWGDIAVIGWKALSICQFTDTNVDETRADLPAWPERTVLPMFNSALSELARDLVVLCGLDPTEATIDDMDGVHERFVCCACARDALDYVDSGSGRLTVLEKGALDSHTVEVYALRAALVHARMCLGPWTPGFFATLTPELDQNIPSFRRASDLGLNAPRRSVEEDERQADLFNKWSCNHCMVQLNKFRNNLLIHILSEHGIAEPVEGCDYFMDPLNPIYPSFKRIYVSMDPVPA